MKPKKKVRLPLKAAKRGRPLGSKCPRPGSGEHPIDRDMAARGYITQANAAEILHVRQAALYRWMFLGRIPREIGGVEVFRRSHGIRGATYYRKESLPALKELLLGVPANPAP